MRGDAEEDEGEKDRTATSKVNGKTEKNKVEKAAGAPPGKWAKKNENASAAAIATKGQGQGKTEKTADTPAGKKIQKNENTSTTVTITTKGQGQGKKTSAGVDTKESKANGKKKENETEEESEDDEENEGESSRLGSDDDDNDDESDQSDDVDDDGDEAEDDQTRELLKGFDSSSDDGEDQGYDPNKQVPTIPDSKKIKRKLAKKRKANAADPSHVEQPGTIYVGRIPHGFYEHQMRAYFSQFGDITHLRLSRNRVTGNSKHYAFIEFQSSAVAKIAAETVDNYLMFGHILKCKFIPQDQVHPELWKGADRRFKKTPWNRIEKKRLEQGKSRAKWSESIQREQKKRQAKAARLKEMGYELELPKLTSVDEVPKKTDASETANGGGR